MKISDLIRRSGYIANLLAPLALQGQERLSRPKTSAGRPIEFAVVSIKPDKSKAESMNILSPPNSDGMTLVNMPLENVVEWAYGISIQSQLSGLPDWARKERFDITAKVSDADLAAFRSVVDPVQRTPMLQKILADRFGMKCHYETRELPAYALVLAKGGSKMTEIQPAIGPNGMKDGGGREVRPGEIKSLGQPMLPLVRQLTKELGRPVTDRTGLTGYYNYTLQWSPDRGVDGQASADASGPSIFTAVQEQLGLKLEPTKTSQPVLIIDAIETPSVN